VNALIYIQSVYRFTGRESKMTRDDEEHLDAEKNIDEEASTEEIEDGDLEDVSGGLRMNPVSAGLGKRGGLGGVTVQPSGATVTIPMATAGKRSRRR
jgi:hypothetical protein